MAEVIQLTQRRPERAAPEAPGMAPATLYFDLASPYTYLVAERLERRVGGAVWRPADAAVAAAARRRRWSRRRSAAHMHLRMPLVWPERFPSRVPTAMRVATYANEQGCGSAFAIAAGRLAFCGGFDLEDPDILAEAAAAAGLDVDGALDGGARSAARPPDRDGGPLGRPCGRHRAARARARAADLLRRAAHHRVAVAGGRARLARPSAS